jgi:hypothetical protein
MITIGDKYTNADAASDDLRCIVEHGDTAGDRNTGSFVSQTPERMASAGGGSALEQRNPSSYQNNGHGDVLRRGSRNTLPYSILSTIFPKMQRSALWLTIIRQIQ